MLPWLDNIVLQDDAAVSHVTTYKPIIAHSCPPQKKLSSLKRYSTHEFLEQLFTCMTALLTLRPDTSELFVQLWHRLAKRYVTRIQLTSTTIFRLTPRMYTVPPILVRS